jgi:solute carrier family 25 (mitochondrial carnitine/acylcarnitine transporter), member 20/29
MFTGESIAMRVLEPHRKNGEMGSRLNTFIAGSAGGVFQCIVLVPSEVIKVSMQTNALKNHASSVGATEKGAFAETMVHVRHIFKTEGFFGFYKGLGATAARDIPSIGIYFFIYKNGRDLLGKLEQKNQTNVSTTKPYTPSSWVDLMAGGLAGTLSWGLIYPLDVIKTVTQVSTKPVDGNLRAYKDMHSWEVGTSLFKHHGWNIFYRGVGPTVLRAFPVNAATFFLYEKFKVLMGAH